MNAHDIAQRITGLQQHLGRIDQERGSLALDAERGGQVSTDRMTVLSEERARVVAAIEQARLAHGAALRVEEQEARQEAQRREVERQEREARIGAAILEEVAGIEADVDALVGRLNKLVTLYEEHGALPLHAWACLKALPPLIDAALSSAPTVYAMAGRRPLFPDATRDGVRIAGKITAAFPPLSFFITNPSKAA
jgi:hypothetical protein